MQFSKVAHVTFNSVALNKFFLVDGCHIHTFFGKKKIVAEHDYSTFIGTEWYDTWLDIWSFRKSLDRESEIFIST